MIITLIPALSAVLGLLMYFVLSNAKAQEVGRLMFFAGFLVTMVTLSSKSVHLFSAGLVPVAEALRAFVA